MKVAIKRWYSIWGHSVIIAPTNGGKTTLAKAILKSAGRWNKVVVAESNRSFEDFHADKIKKGIHRVSDSASFKALVAGIMDPDGPYKAGEKNLMLLDDFNQQIDTSRGEELKEMYTRGRHKGFRMLHILHNNTAIGPHMRSNVRYLFISDRINQ